jgi:ferric-dicitrate binding protein FerR (iron transport regulator)
MTSRRRETGRILDRFLEELGEPLPSTVRMRRATNRVLENLGSLDTFVDPAAGIAALPASQPKRRWAPVTAVAAALLTAAVLVGTLSLPSSAEPIAKRLNGKFISAGGTNFIQEGKVIRTDVSGNEVLALRDGSQVEMGENVELSINIASDGIQVDLNKGNIIVTAAKQHHGHLYVKTRDCVVSVVGTVFSVKAEPTGSRVAVIEGEVHVQHGDVSQTLLPGQQVATNAEMKAVAIQSEIGWSQDAAVHVAMLQQAAPPVPATPPAPAGTIPSNPDLLGEIRAILAPVDQGDAAGLLEKTGKNRTFFYSLQDKERVIVLPEAARAGILRYFQNWTAPPNSFTFSISGTQGRTIQFSNSKGETFSYGCADCSFVVSENGVSTAASTTEPGVEFKLSADGGTLTATCHAAPCSMRRWITGVSWTTRNGAPNAWGNDVSYTVGQANPTTPQTFTIQASQLMQQLGGSVIFVVTKPAGQ